MNHTSSVYRSAREYELVYILQPDVDPDEADRIASKIQEVVARLGGKITKVDQWGSRRLAYPIRKYKRGIYIYLKVAGYSDLIPELERHLRNSDAVLRYQTIKLRDGVDLQKLAVSPEEVKFERVTPVLEEEPEPTPEERLGVIQRTEQSEEVGEEPEEGEAEEAVKETEEEKANTEEEG
ncbi:MAG: 30S ribosomal protein S6 [Deltaproteobacteria bacterium]|nr:30S ribosomal protein S6 [Sandaracinaceae bacterium]MCX7807299.1 30S ribosomal protein S6 [Deltaproteobacteria bacterium]